MGALDDWIAGLGQGGSLAVVLLVAALLGLRHATDPDHLTAVSTLIVADAEEGPARARRLGLAWGAGHATTLFAFGLPIVLFGAYLPDPVQRAAEGAVGVIIVVLAMRLLVRWCRGACHVHAGGVGEPRPTSHEHARPEALGRTPLAAYGIGLVHGTGGSAGVGLLLLGGISGQVRGAAALLAFATATVVSMTLVSTAFGLALASGPTARRLQAIPPVLGACGLAFGFWYGLDAI